MNSRKLWRKMRAGKKLLKILEPVADHVRETCPDCGGKVVMFFEHEAKHKPYRPKGEECLACNWKRPFDMLVAEVSPCSNPCCRHEKGWHRAGVGACLECACLEHNGKPQCAHAEKGDK